MQRKNRRKKINKINNGNFKIAIVAAEFNNDITEKMLDGAMNALKKNSLKSKNIKVVRVPGAFEIPLSCQRLAESKKYDAIVALGCVVKGETDHCHYVAGECSRGIMNVMIKYSIPIGFGILTVNNLKQAKKRSGEKSNKGQEAAEAVLQMLFL